MRLEKNNVEALPEANIKDAVRVISQHWTCLKERKFNREAARKLYAGVPSLSDLNQFHASFWALVFDLELVDSSCRVIEEGQRQFLVRFTESFDHFTSLFYAFFERVSLFIKQSALVMEQNQRNRVVDVYLAFSVPLLAPLEEPERFARILNMNDRLKQYAEELNATFRSVLGTGEKMKQYCRALTAQSSYGSGKHPIKGLFYGDRRSFERFLQKNPDVLNFLNSNLARIINYGKAFQLVYIKSMLTDPIYFNLFLNARDQQPLLGQYLGASFVKSLLRSRLPDLLEKYFRGDRVFEGPQHPLDPAVKSHVATNLSPTLRDNCPELSALLWTEHRKLRRVSVLYSKATAEKLGSRILRTISVLPEKLGSKTPTTVSVLPETPPPGQKSPTNFLACAEEKAADAAESEASCFEVTEKFRLFGGFKEPNRQAEETSKPVYEHK